jgi:hypothetical protein
VVLYSVCSFIRLDISLKPLFRLDVLEFPLPMEILAMLGKLPAAQFVGVPLSLLLIVVPGSRGIEKIKR